MGSIPAIDSLTLTVAALLILIAATQPVARRLGLPLSVALAVIGVAVGLFAAWLRATPLTDEFNDLADALVDLPVSSGTFLTVFLPLLLFQGAVTIDVRRLSQDFAAVLLLAVLAVIVAVAAIGGAVAAAGAAPLVACLLFGAIVATTDPSAVIALFRELGAPQRLTRLVEGESLLNDATAIAIFSALLAVIVAGAELDPGAALVSLAVNLLGGAALGIAAGRAAVAAVAALRSFRTAQLTVAVASPYVAYVVGNDVLAVSGVIAVVASGLVISAIGRSRFTPDTFAFFEQLLDQLAFWAGSLVFVLAALLAPRLMADVTAADVGVLAIALTAALLSRAAVIFGAFPALTALGLTRRVSAPMKLAIIWGGLRGAVTLALALAVTENPFVPVEIKRFIAIQATGFALFTLLAQGATLRPLMRLLGLDALSPIERAFRAQALSQALTGVRSALRSFAGRFNLADELVDVAVRPYTQRLTKVAQDRAFDEEITDRDRLTVGLIALANQERALIGQQFWSGGLPSALVDRALRAVEAMIDAAREDGRVGYLRAARRPHAHDPWFRMVSLLHARLGVSWPLARQLEARFQSLLLSRIVVLELIVFLELRLGGVLGDRLTGILHDILDQRLGELESHLQALRLQYPGFARALDFEVLERFAWLEERDQIEQMRAAGIISTELARSLTAEADAVHADRGFTAAVDLARPSAESLAALPGFADTPPEKLARLARRLKPRVFAVAAWVLRRGERVGGIYLIASGAVELRDGERRRRLGLGEWFGDDEIAAHGPQGAEVRSLSYSHLWFLPDEDRAAAAGVMGPEAPPS